MPGLDEKMDEFLSSDRVFIGLVLNVSVNRYGQAGTVSSPNHTFFLGKLDQSVNQ